MSDKDKVKAALMALTAQFAKDADVSIEGKRATVDSLMHYGADAVVEACHEATVKGGWTRDKTLLSFVAGFLPERKQVYPEAKPTMTDAELRALIEDVKADAAVKHAADGRERWVELGKMCNRSLAGLGE